MELGNPTYLGTDESIPQFNRKQDYVNNNIGIFNNSVDSINQTSSEKLTDFSIITDPNTGLSYYVNGSQFNNQKESGDESTLEMQIGAWVPDAPSALSVYNQLTIPETHIMKNLMKRT